MIEVDEIGWPSEEDEAILDRIHAEIPPPKYTDAELAEMERRAEAARRRREEQKGDVVFTQTARGMVGFPAWAMRPAVSRSKMAPGDYGRSTLKPIMRHPDMPPSQPPPPRHGLAEGATGPTGRRHDRQRQRRSKGRSREIFPALCYAQEAMRAGKLAERLGIGGYFG